MLNLVHSTVMVQWVSIFELTLVLSFAQQLYTMSFRPRLLSLERSSYADADPGTSKSIRSVQHCIQRHWTTPSPTSQDERSASREPFRAGEHECENMGWLGRRVSWRSEIVLLISKSLFTETGKGHSLFCWSRGTSASLFAVRSRDVGAFAVVFASLPRGGRRFFQLRARFAPHPLLLRAVFRMLRVLPSRNSEDTMPQPQIVTFMDRS